MVGSDAFDLGEIHSRKSVEIAPKFEAGLMAAVLAFGTARWQRFGHRLGPLDEDTQPVRVVPAGQWQAARCTGDYALVSCTVAPGFEFADFSMLRDDADAAGLIRRRQPDMAAFL